MRWLVEVTSLGRAEKDSLYVDADSWQKALQAARIQRGEDGALTGFSIELLEEGCRAVDPSSRANYLVVPAVVGAQPFVVQPGAGVPRPASHAPAPSAARGSVSPTATIMLGSLTPPFQPPVQPVQPPPPVQPPAPAPMAAAPPVAARADFSSMVPSQIVFKREQDATESLPLTYREYVYAVPPGSSETAAATLIQTQLELVRSSLERAPPGKLVNLAVFDTTFQGKPPVPPLATLTWKDWRGAPVLAFPRRGVTAQVAHVAHVAPVAPAYVPPAIQPAPPAPPVAIFPPETAVYVAAPAQPPFTAPAVQPAAVPAPQALVQPLGMPAAPFPGLAPAQAAPTPVVSPAGPWRARAPTPAGVLPTGAPVRARGEDLIADLFEAMHDVQFARDAIDGGMFCLALAMEKLPSLAGIVLLYDINRREFLVTSTRGTGASNLLLRRFPEADSLLALAMRRRRAVVIEDGTEGDAATSERYVLLGGARSVIVAPVMLAGRFLGAIELVNPIDGQPFTESDGNAVLYIAEQFAEFVAARGIVTDPERITAGQDDPSSR
jgi:hypothetical protein